jgi:glutamate racemase
VPFDELPIGIFDSGVGGLTVMREIMRELPQESIIYLGDTARVPYGVRSPEVVSRYSLENAHFLVSQGIKLLVVACNTSSSVSLDFLRKQFSIPVVGVIEPGAKAAVKKTKLKRVAVIGTETTINSKSYEQAIKSIDKTVKVYGIACPLFVPLVEEGWLEGKIVTLTAERYLAPVRQNGADTLILGCTHYPMIKKIISKIVQIPLIDSAVEIANEVKYILANKNMLCQKKNRPWRKFFVTDAPEKFARTGERFLGHKISNIKKIDLGGF